MTKPKYDFAGWVTKNDIRCSDGSIIQHDAFKGNDKMTVPLVWNHQHNDVQNTLGHIVLHNQPEGVYGYGSFNDTESGIHAKEMLKHGDINAMSIGARGIKRKGSTITHGKIFEVSLVLAGANPGATIDTIMMHADDDTEEAIIYTDQLIHSVESELLHEEGGPQVDPEENVTPKTEAPKTENGADDKTIGEIMDTLNPEQMEAVEVLIGLAVDKATNGDDSEEDASQQEGDGEELKQNAFDNQGKNEEVVLHAAAMQDLNDTIVGAAKREQGTLKEIMNDVVVEHGITNIETLFPNATLVTNEPVIWGRQGLESDKIINGVSKVPFSRIKSRTADLTEDEARARGYIKGNEKIEQIFSVASRETFPQTIYKKQKLDRDDIIDITDFDIVAFINKEMRMMLNDEIARAILVGDGRQTSDKSKIKEDKIRPIISDDDFYTMKANYTDAADFLETVILNNADLEGTGSYTMFIDPTLLSQIKLLKGTDGRFLLGHIPSNSELAQQFEVSEIVATKLMKGKGAVIVSLTDYKVGSTKGGEITTFEDFDIDFNQHKYLIETRLSGALVQPRAALYLTPKSGTTTTTTTTTVKA